MTIITDHPYIASAWIALTVFVLYFNYAASKVSGNDIDPHRDEGQ